MTDEPVTVLVTGPTGETMRRLAETVVEDRLAACVNLVDGVTSIYRWEGQLQADSEVLAIMKTTRDRLPSLQLRVHDLHPYDVPEFIAVPIIDGSAAYLDWVFRSVCDASDE